MKRTEELEKIISASSVITVTAHTHPDGDAIGSGCAMLRYLRLIKGKKAALIVPTAIPASLSFIAEDGDAIFPFSDASQECQEWIAASDLVICQDCNSFSRVTGAEHYLRTSNAKKILIDHHLNPDIESFDFVISKIDISSTSELLYWTLKEMSDVEGDLKKLPQSCLDALMTGMTGLNSLKWLRSSLRLTEKSSWRGSMRPNPRHRVRWSCDFMPGAPITTFRRGLFSKPGEWPQWHGSDTGAAGSAAWRPCPGRYTS